MSPSLKRFYVWSGSLKGIQVDAESPTHAVDRAVRENLPCILTEAIRVSLKPSGKHHLDVFFQAPYEDIFPDLFGNEDLEVEVRRVTRD